MPGSAQCAVAITTSTASTIYRMCRYVFGSLLLSSSSSSLMASNLSLNPLTARHTLGKRRPHRNEMSSLWESRVPRPPIMQYSITGNNGLRRPLTLTTLWADILVHFTTQLLILWTVTVHRTTVQYMPCCLFRSWMCWFIAVFLYSYIKLIIIIKIIYKFKSPVDRYIGTSNLYSVFYYVEIFYRFAHRVSGLCDRLLLIFYHSNF